MKKKITKAQIFILTLFLMIFFSCQSNVDLIGSIDNSASVDKKLLSKQRILDNAILFFAPKYKDRYYRGYHEEILTFFKNIVQRAHPRDHFLFVADSKQAKKMQDLGIPQKNILRAASVDIWARDICPVITPKGSFSFIYRPDYHGKSDAKYFEKSMEKVLTNGGVKWTSLPLNFDGGNYVFNGIDKAVVCDKVFDENPDLSEEEVIDILAKVTGSRKIAFLPQEEDEPLGHSDGMVSWLTPNTLLVNSYKGKMRKEVFAELKRVFPKVKLVEVPWTPGNDFRSGIADASGVYTNILHTQNATYALSFGLPADKKAASIISANSPRKVIIIPAGKVSQLGGGIRCLSWQNRKLYKGQILQL